MTHFITKIPNFDIRKNMQSIVSHFLGDKINANNISVLYHIPIGSKNLKLAKHAVAKLFQVTSIELHGPQPLHRGSSYGSNTSQFY
jgi:hypothetical protein